MIANSEGQKNQWVVGSNPATGTMGFKSPRARMTYVAFNVRNAVKHYNER